MKKQQWAVLLFFGLFLLYGMIVVKDYGISTDEIYQRDHSLGAYKELVPSVAGIVTDTVDFQSASSSPYGVLIQLPLVMIEHLTQFSLTYRQIFLIRHIYTFLLFYGAVICFYRICRRYTDSPLLALAGPLMLILSPRILAESFYNIKDIVCMSLMTMSLYFGLRLIDRTNIGRMIPFVITGVLCADSRIVGAVVFPVVIGVILLKGRKNGQWKKQLCYLIVGLIGLLVVYCVMTGKTPADLVKKVINTVTTFSNYAGWDGTNYYFGQYYAAGTNPRHYIFAWIALTTPVCYLVLFLIGLADCIRRRSRGNGYDAFVFLTCMGIPLAYILICNPVLYNGWRHFYFIYPELLAIAYFGFLACIQKSKQLADRWKEKKAAGQMIRVLPGTILAISMIGTALWIGKNHPYEYVYFNIWSESYAFRNFNKDYWHVSEDQAIREVIWQDPAEKIKICTLLENNSYLLSPEERERMEWISQEEADTADYYILCYTEDPETQKFAFWDMYQEIDSVTVDGRKINSTFQRIYDGTQTNKVMIKEETGQPAYDLNGDIIWSGNTTQREITGTLRETVTSDRMHLDMDGEREADTLTVWVSSDGVSWTQATCLSTEYGITVDYPSMELAAVRVCWEEDTVSDIGWTLGVTVYYGREVSYEETQRNRYLETVTASEQPWEAINAVDGDQNTRWSTGVYQESGMSYTVKLTESCHLAGVMLDCAASQWDNPVNLIFYSSQDGEEWEEIPAEKWNEYQYAFLEPVTARYLRMEIGELQEVVPYNWSIDELYIFVTEE